MKVTYDRVANAAYIYLTSGEKRYVAESIPCEPTSNGPMVVIDLDKSNKIIGFEVLDARSFLPMEILESAGLL